MFGTGRFPEREESETIPLNDLIIRSLELLPTEWKETYPRRRVVLESCLDYETKHFVESVAYNTGSKLALEGR
nr:MAG: hypothetical protein H3Bulk40570_000003 [Mitovirus sp.]